MSYSQQRSFYFFALLVSLFLNFISLASAQVATPTSLPTFSGGMSGQAILAVSTSVVALTQFAKWSKMIEDKRGPLLVLSLSVIGVLFWGWSTGDMNRASSFGYFAGWITVATSAAGVYGFTRAAPESVTSTN